MWYPPNVNAASDNILLTVSSATVIEIQDDTSSTYIVCLEPGTKTADKMPDGIMYTSISRFMPEPTTIALLALCGFLWGRRKRSVRSLPLYI
jgi:hypothetical protein